MPRKSPDCLRGSASATKLVFGAASVVAFGVLIAYFGFIRSEPPRREHRERPFDAPTEPSFGARSSSTPSVRAQVREAVERDAQLVSSEKLPEYLDALVERARTRGRVTALESEVGLEMIARIGGSLETQLAFVNRLNAIADDVTRTNGTKPAGTAAPSTISENAARQALLRDYVEQTNSLDPDTQLRAAQKVNELIQGASPQAPNSKALEDLWAAVVQSRGADRDAATERLLQAIERLPVEQQVEQAQRLNQLLEPKGGRPPPSTPD